MFSQGSGIIDFLNAFEKGIAVFKFDYPRLNNLNVGLNLDLTFLNASFDRLFSCGGEINVDCFRVKMF